MEKIAHKVVITPRWNEGWQRFMARIEGWGGNDDPAGFGKTPEAARQDLINTLANEGIKIDLGE